MDHEPSIRRHQRRGAGNNLLRRRVHSRRDLPHLVGRSVRDDEFELLRLSDEVRVGDGHSQRGDLENKQTRRFLTIDTKSTEATFDGIDYIGLTLNCVDIDNKWHLMSYRMKLSTAELVDLMYNWYATHGLEAVGYAAAFC